MMLRRLAWCAALLVNASGCAFMDGHARLDAVPTTSPTKGGAGREVIVFPVRDDRDAPRRCGVKRNGFGMATADVLCQPEPDQWLGQVMLRALDRAGFKVVTTLTAKSVDPLRIRLNLKHLFVDQVNDVFTIDLVTDVHVTIDAETDTGLLADRSFFVKGLANVLVVVDSGIQASMDDATEDIVEELVVALVDLNRRYPSAGARTTSRPGRGSSLALWEGSR
jgi:hypothetical protein